MQTLSQSMLLLLAIFSSVAISAPLPKVSANEVAAAETRPARVNRIWNHHRRESANRKRSDSASTGEANHHGHLGYDKLLAFYNEHINGGIEAPGVETTSADEIETPNVETTIADAPTGTPQTAPTTEVEQPSPPPPAPESQNNPTTSEPSTNTPATSEPETNAKDTGFVNTEPSSADPPDRSE